METKRRVRRAGAVKKQKQKKHRITRSVPVGSNLGGGGGGGCLGATLSGARMRVVLRGRGEEGGERGTGAECS